MNAAQTQLIKWIVAAASDQANTVIIKINAFSRCADAEPDDRRDYSSIII